MMTSKAPDLNDARVEAYDIARKAGMSVDDFNRIWRIIVPAARRQERLTAR